MEIRYRDPTLEKLENDPKFTGGHSMRLNDQWRLIFSIETDLAGKYFLAISIEDYHD